MQPGISVIIPVFNGEKSLLELCHRIEEMAVSENLNYEILLIDDASQDDSFSTAVRLNASNPNIKAFQLSRNFGQQNAIMCGLNYSNYDYVLTMDDDLQQQPEDIPLLLRELELGYDVVYGIAQIKMHSFYRNLGSKLTNYFFNKVLKKPRYIRISSFRVMKKEIADRIVQYDLSFVYLSAIIMKLTKNISNVPIRHTKRKYNVSNYNFMKLLKIFVKLYIYYSNCAICKLFRSKKPQYEISKIKF